ncbi:hypothetical protein T01_16037 [Trichinella spiralis]|uniref:DUF5641 domain-containing protein n=1 Tax=Trichinella spiralis TaxID=6334 RepID=A0A0V1AR74_TRISP|nr:hypothetical protein T01_16037 [Trichinella spiralis]
MLPTKRELAKRGGRAGSNRTDDTDAETNPQIDTGVSSFNNDLGGNPGEARNEPARESGSLQLRFALDRSGVVMVFDIILKEEDNLNKRRWMMGRVLELFYGRDDGIARSVRLKVAIGEII